jgi:hypothetical protein
MRELKTESWSQGCDFLRYLLAIRRAFGTRTRCLGFWTEFPGKANNSVRQRLPTPICRCLCEPMSGLCGGREGCADLANSKSRQSLPPAQSIQLAMHSGLLILSVLAENQGVDAYYSQVFLMQQSRDASAGSWWSIVDVAFSTATATAIPLCDPLSLWQPQRHCLTFAWLRANLSSALVAALWLWISRL